MKNRLYCQVGVIVTEKALLPGPYRMLLLPEVVTYSKRPDSFQKSLKA